MEFPRFDGSQLKDWLYKCEQFFSIDNTTPENKVRLASMHLYGIALQWHLNYMRGRFQIYPDWPQYISDLSLRFGEVYSDPLAELIGVKHVSMVQEYIDAFELALTQVNLPEEHILSIFLAGLEKQTQMNVRMFNPLSRTHAAKLARLYEASHPLKQPYSIPINKIPQNSTKHKPYPKHKPHPKHKTTLHILTSTPGQATDLS